MLLKKMLSGFSTLAVTSALVAAGALGLGGASASPTSTSTIVLGNSPISAATVDTYRNFLAVDGSAPATTSGYINEIKWYADVTGSDTQGAVQFAVVQPNLDGTFTIEWLSSAQALPASSGVQTLALGQLVPVIAGDDLGVYSAGTGVVPFSYSASAAPAFGTNNDSGPPPVGTEITPDWTSSTFGQQGRVYSMQGNNVSGPGNHPSKTTLETVRAGYGNSSCQDIANNGLANDNVGSVTMTQTSGKFPYSVDVAFSGPTSINGTYEVWVGQPVSGAMNCEWNTQFGNNTPIGTITVSSGVGSFGGAYQPANDSSVVSNAFIVQLDPAPNSPVASYQTAEFPGPGSHS